MESMYFASYAMIATLGVLIIGWAQYVRRKAEGAPLKLKFLNIVSAIAVALWASAGVTALAFRGGGTLETVIMVAALCGAVLVGFFAWHMRQIGEQMARDRKNLSDLATRDALTNSWNRRIFQENLLAEIKRAQTAGQALSLLMFDIDDFHEVNAEHGYKIGDGILRELVARLFNAIRQIDTVYRYGGEEIALILPGLDCPAAKQVAANLTQIISEQPYDVGGHGPIAITVSIGIAALSKRIGTEELLIENAITALRAAKAERGNFIAVCDMDG